MGSRAADAGHSQQAAARHGEWRDSAALERSCQPRPERRRVLPLGLVRWGILRGLAMRGPLWSGVTAGWLLATFVAAVPSAEKPRTAKHHPEPIFKTSDSCLACHNGLTTSS